MGDTVAFRAGVAVTVSYPWVARYARLYMERLRKSVSSGGEELSDIWYSFDTAQEMAQMAFDSCNSSRERTKTARRFDASRSLTIKQFDSTISDHFVGRVAAWLKDVIPGFVRKC